MKQFKILAVLSDGDGVAYETEPQWYSGYRNFMKTLGCDYTKEMHKELLRMPARNDTLFMIKKFGLDPLKEEEIRKGKYEAVKDAFIKEKIIITEGYIDFLRYLNESGIKIALVTQSQPEIIDIIMEKTGLRKYFSVVLSARQVTRIKPFPDCYLKAAELLKIGTKDCVAIEDTAQGLASAKAAGLACIIMPGEFTKGNEFPGADAIVPSIRDAQKLINFKGD